MTGKLYLQTIGTGPPLILLHGWGWHSGIWQPIVPQLAEHYQLFLVDLPGSGKSSYISSSYNYETVTSLLFEHLPEKATWLGWSLGGMIAWWTAIHYPEKVTRLITVGSTPKFVSDEAWPGVATETLQKFTQSLCQDYQKTLSDFLELQLRGSPENRALCLSLREQLLQVPPTALPALLGGLALLRDSDLRNVIGKVTCPSLHLFGALDTLVPVRVVEQIQTQVKGRCEIIKRSGHIPFLSQPQDFLDQLLR